MDAITYRLRAILEKAGRSWTAEEEDRVARAVMGVDGDRGFLRYLMGVARGVIGPTPGSRQSVERAVEDYFGEPGFVRALRSYDPERGRLVALVTMDFARFCRWWCQQEARLQKAVPLNDAVEVRDPTPGPDSVVQRRDAVAATRDCIRLLSETDSRVLRLLHEAGWSHKDIARELGISEVNSRQRAWLGLRKVRQCLARKGITAGLGGS